MSAIFPCINCTQREPTGQCAGDTLLSESFPSYQKQVSSSNLTAGNGVQGHREEVGLAQDDRHGSGSGVKARELLLYCGPGPPLTRPSLPTAPQPRKRDSKCYSRASLVAQWLRVCLPMQGTRFRALVWEDPTCRGAARPVGHSC